MQSRITQIYLNLNIKHIGNDEWCKCRHFNIFDDSFELVPRRISTSVTKLIFDLTEMMMKSRRFFLSRQQPPFDTTYTGKFLRRCWGLFLDLEKFFLIHITYILRKTYRKTYCFFLYNYSTIPHPQKCTILLHSRKAYAKIVNSPFTLFLQKFSSYLHDVIES